MELSIEKMWWRHRRAGTFRHRRHRRIDTVLALLDFREQLYVHTIDAWRHRRWRRVAHDLLPAA